MRQMIFLNLNICAMMLIFVSCQKNDIRSNSKNDILISKINNWLDKQKSPAQPNKGGNIDLLKSNIDYSGLKSEDFNQNQKFIVIPIKNEYKLKKNISNKTIPVLLLMIDKSENIVQGNIVLYFPEDGAPMKTIPINTFNKMYTNKNLECNGLFRFLSPTGRWLFQRDYKEGKLKSIGIVRNGNNDQERIESDCTYYFLILYFWVDGAVVDKEVIYLGRTCEQNCDDPNIESFCADGGGGGAAGSEGVDEQKDECMDLSIESLLQEVNGARVASQTEGILITDIDPITKSKNPRWTILNGAFGTWRLTSQEIGVIKLIDIAANLWAWKSLVHGSITMTGSPMPTTVIEHDQGIGTPSFTPETAAVTTVLYAGMSLNFSVKYRLVCPQVPFLDLFPPIYNEYTATSTFWDSKPA